MTGSYRKQFTYLKNGSKREEVFNKYGHPIRKLEITPFSGMSPKYVKDPVKRAEYERAIQENAENNNLNARQSILKDFKESFSNPINQYVSKAADESFK